MNTTREQVLSILLEGIDPSQQSAVREILETIADRSSDPKYIKVAMPLARYALGNMTVNSTSQFVESLEKFVNRHIEYIPENNKNIGLDIEADYMSGLATLFQIEYRTQL